MGRPAIAPPTSPEHVDGVPHDLTSRLRQLAADTQRTADHPLLADRAGIEPGLRIDCHHLVAAMAGSRTA
ncbi:hypothetical protein [Dactylosporangium sp. NPDC049140]|uniref:hypothetical protein n=1 Tax=Dactylosporangium sp. NPDC049140 TaxID=3155647 RepID=UPI0033DB51F2